MTNKQCGRCELLKPVVDFGPDKRTMSGLKSICKSCDNQIHREWYAAHKDEPIVINRNRVYSAQSLVRYAAKRARGECYFCKEPAVEFGQTRCKRHSVSANIATKARHAERRNAAMAAYGGKCSCCGESNPMFLTIDHKDGEGNKHRRSLTKTGKANCAGSTFYYWLERQSYPDNFQILCSNCNHGRYRNGGICPHKEKLDGTG